VDQAFQLVAVADGPDRVKLSWQIADGYLPLSRTPRGAQRQHRSPARPAVLPTGEKKTDEFFGEQEVYHHELIATPAGVARRRHGLELPLAVTFQGCAEAGLCYPPETKTSS
jgi:thiol:disulfide interchange protein DsbD